MFENTNQTPPKLVNNITNWVVDIGATRHICLSKELFLNYEEVIDEENVYLGDSGTARVARKGKVLLKFTSGKSLALHYVVHVPNMYRNLECVWIEIIHSCVFNFTRFPFFLFSAATVDPVFCEQCTCALFMDPTNSTFQQLFH